nr:hypothetical protein CFP56_24464 [Quercus suber]
MANRKAQSVNFSRPNVLLSANLSQTAQQETGGMSAQSCSMASQRHSRTLSDQVGPWRKYSTDDHHQAYDDQYDNILAIESESATSTFAPSHSTEKSKRKWWQGKQKKPEHWMDRVMKSGSSSGMILADEGAVAPIVKDRDPFQAQDRCYPFFSSFFGLPHLRILLTVARDRIGTPVSGGSSSSSAGKAVHQQNPTDHLPPAISPLCSSCLPLSRPLPCRFTPQAPPPGSSTGTSHPRLLFASTSSVEPLTRADGGPSLIDAATTTTPFARLPHTHEEINSMETMACPCYALNPTHRRVERRLACPLVHSTLTRSLSRAISRIHTDKLIHDPVRAADLAPQKGKGKKVPAIERVKVRQGRSRCSHLDATRLQLSLAIPPPPACFHSACWADFERLGNHRLHLGWGERQPPGQWQIRQ